MWHALSHHRSVALGHKMKAEQHCQGDCIRKQKGAVHRAASAVFLGNNESSLHANSLTPIKSFKNNVLGNVWLCRSLQFAMVAFWADANCTMSKVFWVGHLPTLKKPKDDMTKVGLPVNMLAVHRTAVLAGDFVSQ